MAQLKALSNMKNSMISKNEEFGIKRVGMAISEEASFQVLSNVTTYDRQMVLAKHLGFSIGKVNYIIKALVDKGFVKVGNFAASEQKSKYILTPEGIKAKLVLTEAFIARKKAEYEQLQQQLEQTQQLLKQQGLQK